MSVFDILSMCGFKSGIGLQVKARQEVYMAFRIGAELV